jgi:MFS family permease
VSLLEQISQQYTYKNLKGKSESTPRNVSNTTSLVNTCNISTTSGGYYASESDLNSKTGHWLLCLKLAAAIPAIFTAIILGMWSDKAGRKIVLVISLCGGLIQASVYLLVINLDLSTHVLLAGNIAYGISGYITLTVAMCMAYIADVTSKNHRTIRIVILSTVIGVGSGLAEFISGYWIQAYGFLAPLWLIFSCNIVNIIYILIFVPETIIRDYRGIPMANWKLYVVQLCRLFSNHVCRSIWCWLVTIYLVSFYIVNMVLTGYYKLVITYSINWPFCFGEIYIQYLSGGVACTFITSLIGVKLLQLVPWFSNHWIIEFGLFSAAGGLILAACTKTTLVMFMGNENSLYNIKVKPVLKLTP